MSSVKREVCALHSKWLLSIGTALLMCGLSHATQIVPCAGIGGGTPGLIHAIETANNTLGSNTINLAPGCVFTLTAHYQGQAQNGLPPITGTITINGYGATIAAGGSLRILAVASGGSLTLNRVIVRGGHAETIPTFAPRIACEDGGTDGSLADYGAGGGVCVDLGGKLTLNYSTVTENLTGSIESIAQGGGIYSLGCVTLNYSVVSQNRAFNSSDLGGQGGGIYNNGGTLTLLGSSVHHNTARVLSLDRGFAGGGGIFSKGKLIMRDSSVSYNSATAGAQFGATAIGGGIASDGTTILVHSVVRNNVVAADGGHAEVIAAGGGLDVAGTVIFDRSFIFSNTATATSTFPTEILTPTAVGGGLAIGLAKFSSNVISVKLIRTTVHCNTARAPKGEARGGGINNGAGGVAILGQALVINNRVQGETVASSLGGGIYNANTTSGSVTLVSVTIKGNHPDQCDPKGTVSGCTN